ncbi:KGW motif small protein [Acinetobacter sp. YH12219]|nr:KGW motif small protein [Acinetobacter sp. YH12219]
MIITVAYSAVDKSALRKKGWKIFGAVVCLQLVFLVLGYVLQM